jgi:hypothetical protein
MTMATTRYDHNRAGYRAILRSDEVRRDLGRRAETVRRTAERDAPPDQEVFSSDFTGSNRARASVIAPGGLDTEVEERYLGRAIDSARG